VRVLAQYAYHGAITAMVEFLEESDAFKKEGRDKTKKISKEE